MTFGKCIELSSHHHSPVLEHLHRPQPLVSASDGRLDGFHLGAAVSSAAIDVHMWVFVWTHVFISLGHHLFLAGSLLRASSSLALSPGCSLKRKNTQKKEFAYTVDTMQISTAFLEDSSSMSTTLLTPGLQPRNSIAGTLPITPLQVCRWLRGYSMQPSV